MLDIVVKLILLIALLLQVSVMIIMFISNYKREKEEKKFWDKLHADLESSTEMYINAIHNLELDKTEKTIEDESEQKK